MAAGSAAFDHAARVDRLRRTLAERELDAAVIRSPANIAYLSGFHALMYSRPISLVVDQARTTLVVPGLEEEHAAKAATVDDLAVYHEHPERGKWGESAIDTLGRHLHTSSIRRLGLEYATAPIALREQMTAAGIATDDISPALALMRLRKDDIEIAAIRHAAALARIGVMATLAAATPGRSNREIASIGTAAILDAASAVAAEATIDLLEFTTSGPETSLPHLITSTRRLTRPDLVIHSRQVAVDGLRAELERTFALDTMDAATRRCFDVMEEAQLAAIAAIRPGIAMGEVDAAARRIIQQAGYGDASIHRTGHGLGIEAHEPPTIRWDDEEPMASGMVVSIEPGIYLTGRFGVRHSDTVIVTVDGHESITEAPRGADALTLER